MAGKTSPLALFKRVFGPKAPDPSELRVVSPTEVHPDLLMEGFQRAEAPLLSARPQFNARDKTLPNYSGATYEDLMRFLADEGTPLVQADRVARGKLTDLRAAHNLGKGAVQDVMEGHPGVYKFLYHPGSSTTFGAIKNSPLEETSSQISIVARTPNIEEINSLASMAPGGGIRLMRAAQSQYDPAAERATSLLALPRAYPFYKARGMRELAQELPGVGLEDLNWQTHVLPKGERFAKGGLARCKNV